MTQRGARVAVSVIALVALAATGVIVALRSSSGGDGQEERVAPATPARDAPTPAPGRLAGYVRDVNGDPVPGAEVAAAGQSATATSDATGRYELRVPRGEIAVTATGPGHVPQRVALAGRPLGGRLDFSLAATGTTAPSGAHRVIFWTGCEGVARMTEEELDGWIDLGVDGFVCSAGRLASMGGDHAFSGDPDADLSGNRHRLERALRASAAARKAQAGELKLYLGFYASNALNRLTPFAEWFDDRAWAEEVLPSVRGLAAAARSLGFAGVAIDQELYPVSGEETASWSWDYAGDGRSEADVRAQVAERGRQLMEALLDGYPGVELAAYDTEVAESWSEKVQEEVNDLPEAFASDVRIDLWDGLSSVPGYSAIRWLDATLYKTPHLGEDWAPALRYNANRIYSLLSRRLSNWEYASSRLHLSPFSWIDQGPSEFERARDPGYVAAQLEAFREWGAGGLFANYAYRELDLGEYEPYAQALEDASRAEPLAARPPRLEIESRDFDGELVLTGTARDDLAIRAVRWYDDQGRSGTAELEADVPDGYTREEARWTVKWRIDAAPAPSSGTRITVVAEDISGLAATRTLTVRP